jgi:hypothetical protein
MRKISQAVDEKEQQDEMSLSGLKEATGSGMDFPSGFIDDLGACILLFQVSNVVGLQGRINCEYKIYYLYTSKIPQ